MRPSSSIAGALVPRLKSVCLRLHPPFRDNYSGHGSVGRSNGLLRITLFGPGSLLIRGGLPVPSKAVPGN